MVSVCAPVAESRATRSPGFAPRCFISGNSTGAIAAMSAAFEPEMPDTRYIAPDQHVVETAPDVPKQARQEVDHGAGHAGHLDQRAKEDEQRHGQQDEVRHAFVHAADQDDQRASASSGPGSRRSQARKQRRSARQQNTSRPRRRRRRSRGSGCRAAEKRAGQPERDHDCRRSPGAITTAARTIDAKQAKQRRRPASDRCRPAMLPHARHW